MWHRFRLWRLAFLAPAAAACGPSFQAVYECDVRFEHCYAMDEQSVSPDSKKECWRNWLHAYTYGQSRDRLEYAAARYGQLQIGASLPSEESSEAGVPMSVTQAVAAPVPTSAFAPPPNVAASATVESVAHQGDGGMRAPGAECSDACTRHWNVCHDGCGASAASAGPRPAGEKARSCEECDRGYRACVPACFRDTAGSSKAEPHTVE